MTFDLTFLRQSAGVRGTPLELEPIMTTLVLLMLLQVCVCMNECEVCYFAFCLSRKAKESIAANMLWKSCLNHRCFQQIAVRKNLNSTVYAHMCIVVEGWGRDLGGLQDFVPRGL